MNADKTVGPRKILVNKGARPEDKPIWIEGPHLYKINGNYFLMSAEGGTAGWHSEVIFRGDSSDGQIHTVEEQPYSDPASVGCGASQSGDVRWTCRFGSNPGRGLVGSLSGLPSHKQHVREFRT